MKFLRTVIFITLWVFLPVASVYATDPCVKDIACHKVDNTRFDNPYHYVFVGVYPGDERIIYPLMKDHCSHANSYCAMVIPTRGKSGCEFSSGDSCGDIRTAELHASAEYLNADLWHYDLPDNGEIIPHTITHVRNTYNSIAQTGGFLDVSDYFEFIFQRLQSSNNEVLSVISLNPDIGPIHQPEDITVHVLDEFIVNAVERLQKNGINIVHFYADSQMQSSEQFPYVSNYDDKSLECRDGRAQLRTTHRSLTNFEVFEYGFYEIYPSQLFHTGQISSNPGFYKFCYDNSVNYYNTARTEKLLGVLLTEPDQLDEINGFSNAFALGTRQISDITDYLNKNIHGLLPVISIGHYFFDEIQHAFNAADVSPIVQAINKSSHTGPVIFLYDEPLWRIRFSCLKGVALACEEVNSNYKNTLSQLKKIGRDLRKSLPGSGVMHIEAHAELAYQKHAAPLNDVIMLDDAEYLGFDCYGAFDDCGIVDISDAISNFQDSGIEHDAETANVLSVSTLFVLTGSSDRTRFVCSGSLDNCVTASASDTFFTERRSQQTYIDWLLATMHAMETQHSIGRKLFLVPGAFQDFNFFPSEAKAINQLRSFMEVFDSSDKFGGLGSFIWGNMQESGFPFIGTRSLANVRTALTNGFRARISANRRLNLPPVMTLVGAIGTRGVFDQIKTGNATHGDVYFQNAGMDSCTLIVGSEPAHIMKLNQLNHLAIPNLKTPLNVKAQCHKGDQLFTKQVRFIN